MVHLQEDLVSVELPALVVDPVLPDLPDEREDAVLGATLDVQTEVALGITADEALMGLYAPVLALQGLPRLLLGHLCGESLDRRDAFSSDRFGLR